MIGAHVDSSDETLELAVLYALDCLSPKERLEYEIHLADGCRVCATDIQSLRHVAGQLALAAPPIHPPSGLRERLMAEISSEQTTGSGRTLSPVHTAGVLLNEGGVLIARSRGIPWQPIAPGLQWKPLFVDELRKHVTALVRMEPGARYPSHRHADVEQLFLLEGDLTVEGNVVRPGDYCRAEPGSVHGETTTESGCLFILSASREDELIV